MPFVDASGIKGQLWVPEEMPGRIRKYDCLDCASCMLCNDDKCAMCREQGCCADPVPGSVADDYR